MKKQLASEILTTIMIAFFLYASFSKYADFAHFKKSMHNQPFPGWFADFLVWTIPPVEIMIALVLTTEKYRKSGIKCFIGLMSVFTLYILAIKTYLFGVVPCSCGGIISSLSWGQHLLLNMFFIMLAIATLKINIRTKGVHT